MDSLADLKLGRKRSSRDIENHISEGVDSGRKIAKKNYADDTTAAMSKVLVTRDENGDSGAKQSSIQGHVRPSPIINHVLCLRFRNRLAAEGIVPYLQLRPQPRNRCTGEGANLHELLLKLGASIDCHGKPVVTRSMAKHLRRALAHIRKEAAIVDMN